MSEIGPHDTLHLEWIIHICLRHIWGTYPQWQLNKITKKVTPLSVSRFVSYTREAFFNDIHDTAQILYESYCRNSRS